MKRRAESAILATEPRDDLVRPAFEGGGPLEFHMFGSISGIRKVVFGAVPEFLDFKLCWEDHFSGSSKTCGSILHFQSSRSEVSQR